MSDQDDYDNAEGEEEEEEEEEEDNKRDGGYNHTSDSANKHEQYAARPTYVPESEEAFKMSSIEDIMQKADTSKLDEMDRLAQDVENLGENFEDTPWVPPTLEKALEFKMKNVYRMGNAPLRHIKVVNTPDLSEGVSLYFQFTKSIAVFMFVSTILSIPLILFTYFGERVPQQDRDALNLYRFTLGNMGYNPDSPTYFEDSKCSFASNSTCIHVGSYLELPLETAANVITAMEFLQILAFLITIWYLSTRTNRLKKQNEALNCSASDYTVMIRGLPSDTTSEQLITFFSNLYPLDKPDWRNRPPLEGAQTVQESFNSGNPACRGTWVAEAVVHKRIGSFIRAFKDQQHIMEALYRSRAQMKMYAENTPHAGGPNPRRYLRAENNMIRAAASIDMIAERQLRKNRIKLKEIDDAHGKNIKDPQHNIDAPAVAGFVTFEYCESMARCVEDYERYSTFPWSLCYPPELKFRGQRIRLWKAPEPDEMVWENLEVNKFTKLFRRARTALFTIIALIFCFVVILQSTIYKDKFNSKIPNLGMCYTDIPDLFSYNNTGISLSKYELVRPSDTKTRTSLDLKCAAIEPKSFYAIYAQGGNWDKPMGNYSISACSTGDICPTYGEDVHCPCISTTSKEKCQTKMCLSEPASARCVEFDASTFGACYCMNLLLSMLSSSSVTEAMNNIKSQSQDSTCNQFFLNYSSASGFSYLAIFITVIVNKYLLKILSYLTKLESHSSIDLEQASLIQKIFIALYFNMAVLVLIASGSVENQPETVKPAHILQGSYKDFDSSWYGNVGTFFITTFIIQSISPLLSNFFSYYISGPINRSCIYPFVSNQSTHKITRQDELNKMEVGPVFDVTTNQAQLLALLFFGMTYASGLPIMMPLACIAFSIYFNFDKLLLARYFQKPPHVGDEIMRIVLSMLPYAAIIRLAIACWMYGNTEILAGKIASDSAAATAASAQSASSDGVSTSSYSNILAGLIITAQGVSPNLVFILKRIGQPTVFPLFVLLVILLAVMLIDYLWTKLPIYWLLKFVSCLLKTCKRSQRVYTTEDAGGSITGYEIQSMNHPLRQEVSPYTGSYFKYLRDKRDIQTNCSAFCCFDADITLTQNEIEEGWEVVEEGDFVIKVLPWKFTTSIGGATRTRGERKKTYELIADRSCSSYSLDRIPAYKLAIEALKQGTASLQDYDAESGKGHKKSIVDKYKEKKATAVPNKAADVWKTEDGQANPVEKKKPKMTSKEKNKAMNVDMYKSFADAEEDDSESEEEEEEIYRKKDDDNDSDGSGLV